MVCLSGSCRLTSHCARVQPRSFAGQVSDGLAPLRRDSFSKAFGIQYEGYQKLLVTQQAVGASGHKTPAIFRDKIRQGRHARMLLPLLFTPPVLSKNAKVPSASLALVARTLGWVVRDRCMRHSTSGHTGAFADQALSGRCLLREAVYLNIQINSRERERKREREAVFEFGKCRVVSVVILNSAPRNTDLRYTYTRLVFPACKTPVWGGSGDVSGP